MIFVPVALNYDRVLEDRILVAAGEAGERRFRASVLSVFAKLLRLLGRSLVGRYHRFGTAAVSFGPPLSLRRFLADRPGADPTRDLGRELMRRIGAVVPVVSVPLVAQILLDEDGLEPADLVARARARLGALRHHAIDAAGDRVEAALEILGGRGITETGADGRIRVVAAQRPLLAYYARSLAHLAPRG